MKVTTLETIAGRIVEETLGVVRGSVLWSRGLKKFSRGGIRAVEYMTKEDVMEGLNQARIDAEDAAQRQAKLLGADAIIGLRIEVVELAGGMFQASAMGNAVKTCALPSATPAFGRRMDLAFAEPANDSAVILPFRSLRAANGQAASLH